MANLGSKKKPRGNYHTHTTLSDGSDSPEKVIQAAIDAGLDEIGISDHFTTTKGSIRTVDDVHRYLREIQALREAFQGKIRVLAGLEIDTSYHNPRRFDLPFQELDDLDFVLFEYVGNTMLEAICTDPDTKAVFSIEDLLEARSRLSCNVGIAHPDLADDFKGIEPDDLARTLKAHDIYVDDCFSRRQSRAVRYSIDGRNYSFIPFVAIEGAYKGALAKHQVRFAPSTDHHDEGDIGKASEASHILDALGFTAKIFGYKGGLQPLIKRLGSVYSAIDQVPESLLDFECADVLQKLRQAGSTILRYQRLRGPLLDISPDYANFNAHLEQAKRDVLCASSLTQIAASFGNLFKAEKKGPIREKLLSAMQNIESAAANPIYRVVEGYAG